MGEDNSGTVKSKHRWRGKFFNNHSNQSDEALAKKEEKKKKLDQDNDVADFLKPSTDKAQQHRDAAAAAFLSAVRKPKIDVSLAQRWPGASEVLGSAKDRSPLPSGGLKKGRKRGCTVSFAITQPEIIGVGGDECEEPSLEVSLRKKANSLSDADRFATQNHLDDIVVGNRHPGSLNKEAERRGIVHRTLTSHGELSPPLKQKMEMGRINANLAAPPEAPQRLGPMGLGERPRPLQRAPTGLEAVDDGVSRPSLDSSYSYEGDNSPHPSLKPSNLAPPLEEDEDFAPKPLKRTLTGWSEHTGDSDEDAPPLPRSNTDDSPLDIKKHFDDPGDPNSFAARLKNKMRVEEGKALHEAMMHPPKELDETSSINSLPPASPPAASRPPESPYAVPPAAAYGQTPPRPLRERQLEQDPLRARVQHYSPSRKPMAPSTQLALDTEARPGSSSSQQSLPYAPPRSRHSPPHPQSASTTYSQTPSSAVKSPYAAYSNGASLQQAPQLYERPSYVNPSAASGDSKQKAYPQAIVPPEAALPSSLQAAPGTKQDPAPQRAPSGRSVTNTDSKYQAEAAYNDFTERVIHMQGIFRLTAELGGPIYEHSPQKWLRVAIWWFVRGRSGMEALIRSRPKGEAPGQERLAQPHVDLAKTCWILSEVVGNHPGLRKYGDQTMENQAQFAREAGDGALAEVYEAHDAIIAALKMLLASIKRHHAMPPTQALIQGQDQTIWVEYPKLGADVQTILAGSPINPATGRVLSPAELIPVGDTRTDFCYFRMSVNVFLWSKDAMGDPPRMPAILSVMRPKDAIAVKLAICSQNELINILVQDNAQTGPTWSDVLMKPRGLLITVQLRHGYSLDIHFSEQDFRSLSAIVDHTNRVESQMRERKNERRLLKLTLRDFSYKDPTNPQAFPAERVRGCRFFVFEQCERSAEGTGKRRLHRGYRIAIVTNPKNRTLSCVNHEVGKLEPLNFEFKTDPDGNYPAMLLRFKEETRAAEKRPKVCTGYLVFENGNDRNYVYGTLTSATLGDEETVFASVPLQSLYIENADPAEGFSHSGKDILKEFKWQNVKAINSDPEKTGLESAPTLMSESLRVVCRHNAGTLTDRMNLNTGDLLIRLPTTGHAELTMLRPPQQDMALAIDAGNADPGAPDALAGMLRLVASASTLRALTFQSLQDLHNFQFAITGFDVLFDGMATTFSIARRRMVVPIYKQWTATNIRLQIVQQDNIIQLLAFFEDFSHADAMNFQLKATDNFEKVDKSGKASVRLVDAKFALPVEERKGEGKMAKEEGRASGWSGTGGRRKFVCLDLVEYPGECDDILIGFENPALRDRFLKALPASTTMERKMTFKRKI